MKKLIHPDFLLKTDEARKLYHDHAESLPIIDFHCHLSASDLLLDRQWKNLTQVWLDNDHYKWRAMRANGVSEKCCTGSASDGEKFQAFAQTMPYLLRNPLYHWSHLELARYFEIDDLLLGPDTADTVWDRTTETLKSGLSAQSILKKSRVEIVCTTDDPVDSLEHHVAMRNTSNPPCTLLPTWRPDRSMAIKEMEAFNRYVDQLSSVVNHDIDDFDTYLSALSARHDFFHSLGCRLSDHGMNPAFTWDWKVSDLKAIFRKARSRQPVDAEQQRTFRTGMLMEFNRMDAKKGWTKQLHIGALRDSNHKMFEQLGANTGFDAISDRGCVSELATYFNALNSRGHLPKTIVYNLNPSDNALLATLLGSFNQGPETGKLQLGSAWWFLDQMQGIMEQIETLSMHGLLRRFVGMVTDSRSFLSFSRHEYFRRILCNLLGTDMAEGRLPHDFTLIGAMVREICYENAATYFGFKDATPANICE